MPNIFKRISKLFKTITTPKSRPKQKKSKQIKTAKEISEGIKQSSSNSKGKMGIGVSKAKGGDNGSKLLRTLSRLIPKRNKNKNEQSKQRKPSNFENKNKTDVLESTEDNKGNIIDELNSIDNEMTQKTQQTIQNTDTKNTTENEKTDIDFKNKKEEIEDKQRQKLRLNGKFNQGAFNRLMENIFYDATEGNSVNVDGELNNRSMKGLQTQMSILRGVLAQDIADTKSDFWSWLEDNWQDYSLQAFRYGSDSNANMGVVSGMSDYKNIISKAYDEYKSNLDDADRYKEESDKESRLNQQAKQAYQTNIVSPIDKLIDDSIRKEEVEK